MLPEANEVSSWGHPNFRAGKKIFASLDHYQGRRCIAFKTERQKDLLKDDRFFVAPYAGHRGWVCLKVEAKLDWKEIESLLLSSYRLVAQKRMLAAL